MSKKKVPTPEMVLPDPDDFPRRWELARANYWEETSDSCDECKGEFRTADVLYVFDAPAVVKGGKYFLCVECGYMAFHSGNFPIATVVFISEEQKGCRYFDLGDATKQRLVEAFAQVDSIHQHVAKLAAVYGGMTAGKNLDEDPS